MADEVEHPGLYRGEPLRQLRGHLGQELQVERDAVELHSHEHGRERHLDLFKHVRRLLLSELRPQDTVQSAGEVGMLAGVARGAVDLHLSHRDLLASRADQVGDRRQLVPEVVERERP